LHNSELLCCYPGRASATLPELGVATNKTEYLFSVNLHTLPTLTTPGERCGDHDVAAYLAQINAMKREFLHLAAGI
jgi:hypothetical protein